MCVYCDSVSDRCSRGDVKDLSGENLQKLIETGELYETLILKEILFELLWNILTVKYGDVHYNSENKTCMSAAAIRWPLFVCC